MIPLAVINATEAKFECIFGRGCDGLCCQNGRPGVYPDEEKRLRQNLKKFLPELRPEARKVVEKNDFVSRRRKGGLPMLRVVTGWCVFFNKGCVLHKVGAQRRGQVSLQTRALLPFPPGPHRQRRLVHPPVGDGGGRMGPVLPQPRRQPPTRPRSAGRGD